jgi:acyl-coenzyme A synthetase/AMP-(fatty) acid ligase
MDLQESARTGRELRYKKLRQVVFVDALPRNAPGKVLEHKVREGLIEPEE